MAISRPRMRGFHRLIIIALVAFAIFSLLLVQLALRPESRPEEARERVLRLQNVLELLLIEYEAAVRDGMIVADFSGVEAVMREAKEGLRELRAIVPEALEPLVREAEVLISELEDAIEELRRSEEIGQLVAQLQGLLEEMKRELRGGG